MLRGLNVHLAGPLGPVSTELAAKQFQLIRFDVESVTDIANLALESIRNGLHLLPIVDTAAHINAVPWPTNPFWTGVEITNEPNINGYTAASYATHAGELIDVALGRGLTPWIGSIYNLHAESQQWLADVLRRLPMLDQRVGITVHRYPWGNYWSTPAKGFGTREDEADELMDIIGGRRFGLSEFGFTEEQQCSWKWQWRWPFYKKTCHQWSSTDVLQLIRQEYAWWDNEGADFAVAYQLNNGPIGSDEQYGIRDFQGLWKPQSEAARVTSI